MRISKLFFLFLICVYGCAGEPANEDKAATNPDSAHSGATQNLNISFLLDLSDRISPTKYPNESMEYYKRDIAGINSVCKAFQQNLLNKKVRTIDDNIQTYFDPPPKSAEMNKYAESMKGSFDRTNVTKERIQDLNITFENSAQKIYEQAISDGHYVGSETWGFFKDKVKKYCLRENCRNILVIFTDGYIYHIDDKRKEGNQFSYLTPEKIRELKLNNSDWKDKMDSENIGFIPATSGLNDLEVLVIGINPDKKNDYEEDVIKKFWGDWLEKMGVARYDILTTDLPTNLDRPIQDFILKP